MDQTRTIEHLKIQLALVTQERDALRLLLAELERGGAARGLVKEERVLLDISGRDGPAIRSHSRVATD